MTNSPNPSAAVVRPPRYSIRFAAEVQHGPNQITATTRNLSVGGACLELDRALPEGAELDLALFVIEDDIESVGGSRLAMRACVQWATEPEPGQRVYQVGIKWLAPTPQQLAALQRALRAVEGQ